MELLPGRREAERDVDEVPVLKKEKSPPPPPFCLPSQTVFLFSSARGKKNVTDVVEE